MIEILKRIRDNLVDGDVEFALDKLNKLIEANNTTNTMFETKLLGKFNAQ